jgi:glucose/arabinose dehydrogenase
MIERRWATATAALVGAVATGSACGGVGGSATAQGVDGSSEATVIATATPEASATPSGDDSGPATTPTADGGPATTPTDGGPAVTPTADGGVDATVPSACSGAGLSTVSPGPTPPQAGAFTVPSGFVLETLAAVKGARELAALPNGDLLVATSGSNIYLVPGAESSGAAGTPVVFATIPDSPAQGIAFVASSCMIYVGAQHGIYAMAYVDKQQSAQPGTAIARVRTGSVSPNRPSGDTDVHSTTSVGFAGGTLYAGVGSSCNACVEVDPTRASIQASMPSGAQMVTRATRIRNPIALATNPATGTLWAGGAGQDNLPEGHPYEFFDAVTLHSGGANYGWPFCEENQLAYAGDAGCAATVAPLVELPAYSTLIGAVFYPKGQAGAHAFPAGYRGGAFLTAHGSWHTLSGGAYASAPRVAYVPMNGDSPVTPVDWADPTKQWTEFVGGFQLADGVTRIGRPTGIAVGSQGSLFVADDQNGLVYRIRPMG